MEARDSGTPFKSARTDVIIRVLDTHNSKPEIILTVFGQGGDVAVLSEFSELGRVVAHLSVLDPDKGLNGIVVCETSASHFQLQAMDVRQYKVILSRHLDRESRQSYDVNVTCQDAGNPPLAATKSFTVQVRGGLFVKAVLDIDSQTWRRPCSSVLLYVHRDHIKEY